MNLNFNFDLIIKSICLENIKRCMFQLLPFLLFSSFFLKNDSYFYFYYKHHLNLTNFRVNLKIFLHFIIYLIIELINCNIILLKNFIYMSYLKVIKMNNYIFIRKSMTYK